MSDQLYIFIHLKQAKGAMNPTAEKAGEAEPACPPPLLRWALKRIDFDMLIAAAHIAAWPEPPQSAPPEVKREARRLR